MVWMRVTLLTLLLTVTVNGGFFDDLRSKVKDLFRDEKTPKFPHDHVNKKGDSITEINEKSKVGGELFQSDIILTRDQAEDIVEDIEEVIVGANRTKRQAVTYRPDVKLWNSGVNHYFNSTLSHAARSVFKKAADVWQKDTCTDPGMTHTGNGMEFLRQDVKMADSHVHVTAGRPSVLEVMLGITATKE
ncbi:hypothetical protein TELCIR_19753 [Teladorsagia circumcincta]|uniref:Peptidase M12A domain-containing protein n=1 Tax=Teladorsagia circumcincta TaxID=45464 RepID=A0A2G9TMV2_TELCI|nr:hypothetical protein TELCIR_19753 [Teladorsagia circumcincta]